MFRILNSDEIAAKINLTSIELFEKGGSDCIRTLVVPFMLLILSANFWFIAATLILNINCMVVYMVVTYGGEGSGASEEVV